MWKVILFCCLALSDARRILVKFVANLLIAQLIDAQTQRALLQLTDYEPPIAPSTTPDPSLVPTTVVIVCTQDEAD
ncbi:MAG: hypothetical protein ACI9UN_002623 [Granulosicoccus sp.]|jgi:hypothetical protein